MDCECRTCFEAIRNATMLRGAEWVIDHRDSTGHRTYQVVME